MAIPATSLAAVTVDSTHPGIGESESLGAVFSKHGGSFTVEDWTGSGQIGLYLEGSLDGDNWFLIAGATAGANGQYNLAPASSSPVFLALYIRARAQVPGGNFPSATVTGVVVSAA